MSVSCKRCGGYTFLDEDNTPSCVMCGWRDYQPREFSNAEIKADKHVTATLLRESRKVKVSAEPEPEPEKVVAEPEPEPLSDDERLLARIESELEPLLERVNQLRKVRRKVKDRIYRVNTRELQRERSRRWRQNHPEYSREYLRQWRKEHPRYWDADGRAKRKAERERQLEIEREEICSVCGGDGHVDCVACQRDGFSGLQP